MSSLYLLQGIFPTQRLNPGLPHCRQILYCLSHQGSLINHSVQFSSVQLLSRVRLFKTPWIELQIKTTMGCQLTHIRRAIIMMDNNSNNNGRESEKEYIHTHTHTHTHTHIYKTLCCILETNNIINQLYVNKIIIINNRKYMCWWGFGETGTLMHCWWNQEQRNQPCIPGHLT